MRAPSRMQKDFDRWNKVKKTINATDEDDRLYFHEGDIWWARLGANVGYEIDGKSSEFSRPVIVLRKYNQYSFLALPLTTNAKPNKWRVPIGSVADRDAFAVLSQLRNIDSRRLIEKKGHVPAQILVVLKKAASRMNFG
jgi:mRNA interferase MazF